MHNNIGLSSSIITDTDLYSSEQIYQELFLILNVTDEGEKKYLTKMLTPLGVRINTFFVLKVNDSNINVSFLLNKSSYLKEVFKQFFFYRETLEKKEYSFLSKDNNIYIPVEHEITTEEVIEILDDGLLVYFIHMLGNEIE